MPMLTIRAQIHADPKTEAVLRDAMRCATKVYNGLLWHLREEQKERGKVHVSRKNLNRMLKTLPRARAYYSMSAQLTRDEVRQAYKAFFALRAKGLTQHNAPGFRRKGHLSPLKYVQSGFRVEGDRVTLSLGTSREDGVRQVSFRISHRPDVQYQRVREVSITYDTETGQLQARLVVEVKPRESHGKGRVAVDLGETVLLAAAFDDGTTLLYSGRLVKAIRRYWQKVLAKVKPPSRENPHRSRRYRQIARKEGRQVEHLLHIATAHFIEECVRRGVKEIAIGNLTGIREGLDYGPRMNQRLHAWPYRKVVQMLRYKGELAGIRVRADVDERDTSRTCPACGKVKASNRVFRGLYVCTCGWKAQADINGALNIYERAYQVSPMPRQGAAQGSSGRVARPVVVSFRLGWHTVHEPVSRAAATFKRKHSLRASACCFGPSGQTRWGYHGRCLQIFRPCPAAPGPWNPSGPLGAGSGMLRSDMARIVRFLLLALPVLGGCSVLPVPVDLLPYLGQNRSGSYSTQVVPGTYTFSGTRLPDQAGYPADFTQANLPVRIGYASLDWGLRVLLEGPQAAGSLTAQVYLAPYEAQNPFLPEYRLGEPVTAQVATGQEVSLSGSATLNAAQLNALNAKKLRLGVELSGQLTVNGSGLLTLRYEVVQATLKVGLF